MSSVFTNQFQKALMKFEAGEYTQSLSILDKVLSKDFNNFDALFLKGVVCGILNKRDVSILFLLRAEKLQPNHGYLQYNIAKALIDIGDDKSALLHHNLTVKLLPNNYDARINFGLSLFRLNFFDEALIQYDNAVNLNPNLAQAFFCRANVIFKLGRFEEAIFSYNKAIDINPNFSEAYCNRGNALQELYLLEEALYSYDQAIIINKKYTDAFYNRGIVLKKLNRLNDALESFTFAISFKKDYFEAYSNRGAVLQDLNRINHALEDYDTSILINPDHADTHWNKSLTLLLTGQFDLGWKLYEYGWINNKRGVKIYSDNLLWLGEHSLKNKTILLHSEQGLGDCIQFCRYASLVKAMGAIVILQVPRPLVNLLSTLDFIDSVLPFDFSSIEFDYHCPLMSLPRAFKTQIDTIPSHIPYIKVDSNKLAYWQKYIGTDGFKIAICWQGSSGTDIDIGRSFPVSLFESIASISGVRLINLQKNNGLDQLHKSPMGNIIEILPDFDVGENAFVDSAAIMSCVDLVITSDTALTHLAGAIGVATWLPLKFVPDWRWMLDRNDSPWYPNHLLFRQSMLGDWSTVFAEMELKLKTLIN
jgi:tetratricopeptide (TPR) repeat protein